MINNIITGEIINKFIFVIATGRSSSNMMIDILNHIDGVNLRYELHLNSYERTTYNNGIKYLKEYLLENRHITKEKANYTITGCKFLEGHIITCNYTETNLNDSLNNIKFIHLYRKNILKQFISYTLAKINNKWINTKNENGV